jgi:Ca-activated chloride channel family protein
MRFAEPQMLAFLALPIVVIAGLVLGAMLRRRSLARFGAAAVVEGQLKRPWPYLRAARAIALVLGVACLAFASARPQYGGRIPMLKKRGIDIVVALDFSKSMLAQDVRPSRIERAKLELEELIKLLTGDRIGLVAFAGDTIRFPLTSDYAAAIAFWRDLTPYDMPVGGTAIGKALTAAVRMLRPLGEDADPAKTAEPARSKVIVLLTDGEDHEGDPAAVAAEAAEQGIVVYTVGFGSDSPELIPRYLDDGTTMGYQKSDSGEYVTTALTPANEDKLKEIAAKTGGRYYRAGAGLEGIAAVVDAIRKMKQTEVEARQITVYDEVFQWFLAPAAALMLLAFALPERWVFRRRRR